LGKTQKQAQKSFEIHRNDQSLPAEKVDVLYELERKIIEILLLYGNQEQEFEDLLLQTNEEGVMEMVSDFKQYKVYQRIYLSLQEDEVELAHPLFKKIFQDLMAYFNQHDEFQLEQYLMHLAPDQIQEITNILMAEEQQLLHKWESKQIEVKGKDQTVAQYVSETILTLRWFLVDRIIEGLKAELSTESAADNSETLGLAMDYSKLIHNFSQKLGRVMSRYH
jgi:DNA primase